MSIASALKDHIAIALEYDHSGAPRVVAKGRGELGEKIVHESGADFSAPLMSDDERMPRKPDAKGLRDKRVPGRDGRMPQRAPERGMKSGPQSEADARNANDKIATGRFKKKPPRRDRSKSGPRPAYPRSK